MRKTQVVAALVPGSARDLRTAIGQVPRRRRVRELVRIVRDVGTRSRFGAAPVLE